MTLDHQALNESEDVLLERPRQSYPTPGWDRGDAKTTAFAVLTGKKYRIDLATTGNVVATLPTSPVVGERVGFWIYAGHATRKLVITAGSSIIAAPGAALGATHSFPYGTNDFEYIELEFEGTYWVVTQQTWLSSNIINV